MALRYGARPVRRPSVFKAIAYQPADDPVREIARRAQPKITRSLAGAFRALRSAISTDEIAAHLAAGNPAGAADSVNLASFAHALRPAFDPIADTYRAGLRLGGAQVRRARLRKDTATLSGDPQQPDEWAVDAYSDEIMADLRGYQDSLIGGMTDQMRQRVFETIRDGVRENLEPAEIARNLRAETGLSVRLAKAIRSYRKGLEQLDPSVLSRGLRDTDGDGAVRAAINSGQALSKDEIDRLMVAYGNRALEYRAAMIAQTESTRAANMGLEASYKQMIASGLMPAEAPRKHWRVALDERTCAFCLAIAAETNAGIAIGELFSDEVSYPPLHPNCRCSIEIVTNLDLVP